MHEEDFMLFMLVDSFITIHVKKREKSINFEVQQVIGRRDDNVK